MNDEEIRAELADIHRLLVADRYDEASNRSDMLIQSHGFDAIARFTNEWKPIGDELVRLGKLKRGT